MSIKMDFPPQPNQSKLKDAIEQMIESNHWHWADDFLTSLYDQMEKGKDLTVLQIGSFRKIRDKRKSKAEELGIENL